MNFNHIDLYGAYSGYRQKGFDVSAFECGHRNEVSWEMRRDLPDDAAAWGRLDEVFSYIVVKLGPDSGGLACRIFHERRAYQKWREQHPDLAKLIPTAQSPHYGFRLFFICPNVEPRIFRGDGRLLGQGWWQPLPPLQEFGGSTFRWIVPLPDGKIPEIDPVTCGLVPGPLGDEQDYASPQMDQDDKEVLS